MRLAFKLLILIAFIQVIFTWSADNAFFQEHHKSSFIRWESLPLPVQIIGEEGTDFWEAVEYVKSQTGELAMSPKGDQTKVFYAVGTSKLTLSVALEQAFQSYFPSSVVDAARKDGAFNFSTSSAFPCATIYVYDPREIDAKPDYFDSSRPEFLFIWRKKGMPKDKGLACLKEEIAHAAYLIPDRNVWFNTSIFNRNAIRRSKVNLTWLDLQHIRFIRSGCLKNEMSQTKYRGCAIIYPWIYSAIFKNP